jgi:hypothetical protein
MSGKKGRKKKAAHRKAMGKGPTNAEKKGFKEKLGQFESSRI